VADILVFFALGLLPFSTFQLFLRAFYAMQDTRTPAVINVFAVGLNVAMNLVYFQIFDVRGLALGHATAYTFAAVAAGLIIQRRLGGLDGKRVLAAVGKILVAGAGTGGAALAVSTWVGTRLGTATIAEQLAQVGAGIGAGVVAFLLISAALRTDELSMLWRVVGGRLGRG
jgi:putative peptidoglycan lipid II flippase